jgi:hypothetical protein
MANAIKPSPMAGADLQEAKGSPEVAQPVELPWLLLVATQVDNLLWYPLWYPLNRPDLTEAGELSLGRMAPRLSPNAFLCSPRLIEPLGVTISSYQLYLGEVGALGEKCAPFQAAYLLPGQPHPRA